MQTDLGSGGLEDGEGAIVASYTYAARYGYSGDVLHNDNQIRLLPREGEGQRALWASVWTLPDGSGVRYGDRFGNGVHRARVVDVHSTLVVATAGRVSLSTAAPQPPDAPLDAAKELPQGLEFLMPSPLVNPDSVSALARSVAGGTRSLLETARLATDWIYREILYKRGATGVGTTAAQVVEAMEGVCQDKTHLGLGMLRSLGAPCRYVSGLLTGQVGETHSWMEFLHPQAGWLGADPDARRNLPAGARLREAGGRTGLHGRLARQRLVPVQRRSHRLRGDSVREVRRQRSHAVRRPRAAGRRIRG